MDLRKAHSHALCKRMDGRYIGGVGEIHGEFRDFVRKDKHIIALILTKRLGQYLMDFSAAIDRIKRRKDTNIGEDWQKTLAFQCDDDWKV